MKKLFKKGLFEIAYKLGTLNGYLKAMQDAVIKEKKQPQKKNIVVKKESPKIRNLNDYINN